jgi:hypothetical protein
MKNINENNNFPKEEILFKEKLERAKKTLSRVGIPEKWRKEFEAKKSSVL